MSTNGQPPMAVIQIALLADGQMTVHAQGANTLMQLGMLELAKANLIAQMGKKGPQIEVAPAGLNLG